MLHKREAGETAFPDLATVVDAVKDASRRRRASEVSQRARANQSRDLERFDAYITERVAEGEAEDAVLARWPSMAKAWREWKNAGA